MGTVAIKEQHDRIETANRAFKLAQKRKQELESSIEAAEREIEIAHTDYEQWDSKQALVDLQAKLEEAFDQEREARRELMKAVEEAGMTLTMDDMIV